MIKVVKILQAKREGQIVKRQKSKLQLIRLPLKRNASRLKVYKSRKSVSSSSRRLMW